MTKSEYLAALQRNLKNMPSDEMDNIMEFYQEYFAEAGIENEEKVMEELGSPASLAIKVSASYVIQDMEEQDAEKNHKKPLSSLWIIVLAICGAPVWSLVVAGAVVLFALIIAAFTVIFAFGVACVAMIVSGIIAFLAGLMMLFQSISTALAAMGLGMLCCGLGILLLLATIKLVELCKHLLLTLAKKRIKQSKVQQPEQRGV